MTDDNRVSIGAPLVPTEEEVVWFGPMALFGFPGQLGYPGYPSMSSSLPPVRDA